MAQSFYITTTLPYVNAKPHIGHALEFIQADVIARYQKQQGKEVRFNVGTDEHGLKIFEKAAENKMPIQDFVDMNVTTFKEFCERFSISYTSFYRTSDASHYTVAQSLREQCKANDDIYEKEYT
jgi:methionyl-tRNA synthetase